VNNHEEARRFYVDRLGLVVFEDNQRGDYRWLLAQPPDTDVAINLELPQTAQQRALVGQQGEGQLLFALATDDCRRDYGAMKALVAIQGGRPQCDVGWPLRMNVVCTNDLMFRFLNGDELAELVRFRNLALVNRLSMRFELCSVRLLNP